MIDDGHLDEFNEKYKIKSARNSEWDYSEEGIYYVTICCWKHNKHFGRIDDRKMILSKIGVVTEKCLSEIPKHFKNVKIDEYVIMPNHVHILTKLSKHKVVNLNSDVGFIGRDVACNVSTKNDNEQNKCFSQISPKPSSIPAIIRSFKSAVTRYANQNKILFAWQSRYYDEIIRDKGHYWRVKSYIKNNLKDWSKDEYA